MWLQTMSLRVKEAIQSARDREEGQGLVEYALILSLVSIASIVVLGVVGADVGEVLDAVENALNGARLIADSGRGGPPRRDGPPPARTGEPTQTVPN